ncbi:hypothetical protein CAP2UW1_1820 [Candidatus Accumulibacter phosphatis]|uniref:Uncharacterized protein n=2 Tax=Betaproteobacteria incertae sedis TaxID=119066 RepID=C7RV42_ACCRE
MLRLRVPFAASLLRRGSIQTLGAFGLTTIRKEDMSEVEQLYARIREKIEHEDDLVNQRQMWMITFNGLLFTAYGFSLGASGSSISGLASDPTNQRLLESFNSLQTTIEALRLALAGVGTLSAIFGLLGVIAAFKAIRDDEYVFAEFVKQTLKAGKYVPVLPSLIGRRWNNVFGMLSGMFFPLLVAGAWIWTVQIVPKPEWFLIGGIVGTLILGLLVWVLLPRNLGDDS